MSGHAILTSCHHCGAKDKKLTVAHVGDECKCGHVHIIVACDYCKKMIWDKE